MSPTSLSPQESITFIQFFFTVKDFNWAIPDHFDQILDRPISWIVHSRLFLSTFTVLHFSYDHEIEIFGIFQKSVILNHNCNFSNIFLDDNL